MHGTLNTPTLLVAKLMLHLPEIVADILAQELSVLVITSGASLTSSRAECFPQETGFELTLFSSEPALHDRIAGSPGAFLRAVTAAANLRHRGCPVAISVVVSRLNAHDVGRTLELGLAVGGSTFLLNRVNLSRLTLPLAKELVPTADQLTQSLDAAEEFATRYGLVIPISVPIPPCVVDLRPYGRLLFGWCPRGQGGDSYYTVSHNGLLRPCNHSSVVLGDLRRRSISELVASEHAAAFWNPVPSPCLTCSYPSHGLCRGGCPAAADECYGTRERWDPVIDAMGKASSG